MSPGGDHDLRRHVEWLGTMWGHAVVPSTPIPDLGLHMRAWQHHFAAIFGLEALERVSGFSPPEMHLPNHPDVAQAFVKRLRECGYHWLLVQEDTVETLDGGRPDRRGRLEETVFRPHPSMITRSRPNAHRPRAGWILLAAACLATLATNRVQGAARSDPGLAAQVKALQERAVKLSRAGRHPDAIQLLTRALTRRPDLVALRVLRARIQLRAGDRDAAAADARAVLAIRPDHQVAREILKRLEGAGTVPREIVVVGGGPASYSEWERIWTIPGKDPFTLEAFRGGQGPTIFLFPASREVSELRTRLEEESRDRELYFLRIVDLATGTSPADVSLPGATRHEVASVPFMIVLDGEGNELGRGDPAALEALLEQVRQQAEQARAEAARSGGSYAEPVSHQDFSASQDSLESLGAPGWSTLIMVTSPG